MQEEIFSDQMDSDFIPSSSCIEQVPPPTTSSKFAIPKLHALVSTKPRHYSNIQSKILFVQNIALTSQTISVFSKSHSLRKVLKNARRVKVDKSCKKLPYQLTNSVKNCKGFSLTPSHNLFPQKNSSLTNFLSRSSPLNLKTLKLTAAYPYFQNAVMRRLFHLVGSERNLRELILNINLKAGIRNINMLAKSVTRLENLQSLSLAISMPLLDKDHSKAYGRLASMVTSMGNLKDFSFKCYISKLNCADIEMMIDMIAEANKLQSLGLTLQTMEQLPSTFYSAINQKVAKFTNMNKFLLAIDSYMNQSMGIDFFSSFTKLQHLEDLSISVTKLTASNQEIQTFFEALATLKNLKDFHFESNGRVLTLPPESYSSLCQTLSNLPKLNKFSFDIKNLNTTYFPALFNRLPQLPSLSNLRLNIALNNNDQENVGSLCAFLKRNPNMKSLSLKINENESNIQTVQVPPETFNTLGEGLKRLTHLENLELTLGIIEDSILEKIIVVIDTLSLSSLTLVGFFQNITYETFIRFCECLKGQSGKLKEINVVPRCYPHTLCQLIDQVALEINNQ